MLKVLTLLGTRPELIKMSRVLAELDLHVEHTFVHSGQNYDYELNQVFFDELGIRKPDHFLECQATTPMGFVGEIIARFDAVLEQVEPDAVLLYGDTNTCLGVIAAKRRQIPVFHMEAGNRCFDQRVPEESNRKIVDHLSDINLVLTEHARRYLITEGIRPETIIKTGSHMPEVLNYFMPNIKKSEVLARLNLESGKYFVVSAHREENVDDPDRMRALLHCLAALTEAYGLPVMFSTHPRTRKRLAALGTLPHPDIQFVKPFGFVDYIKLQMDSACVLSDSGTITEEAAILNLPAVTLRDSHERPEGMDQGVLVMTGLKKERVLAAVGTILEQRKDHTGRLGIVSDYQPEMVSQKILRTVLSYTAYVNRTVWYR